jgi:hypothetical protein
MASYCGAPFFHPNTKYCHPNYMRQQLLFQEYIDKNHEQHLLLPDMPSEQAFTKSAWH